MSGSSTVGVALFGLGRIGRIHAKNLIVDRRVEIRWIVEEYQEGATEFMSDNIRLENAKLISFNDVEEVWSDKRTHAIFVCTPTNYTHKAIILGGLSAGKAVFCEKPLAPDLASVKDCYLEAENTGQILYCGFNRRFDPSIRSVKDRIRAGEIGEIHQIRTTARDPKISSMEYMSKAGDFFHDSGIHDLDMVCWLVGDAPKTVFAQGHAFNPLIAELGDLDEVNIILKFPSGVLATIDMSREAVYGYDQRVEVLGSKGMLQIGNKSKTTIVGHSKRGATCDPILAYFTERYKESYQDEVAHFLDAVQGKVEKLEVSMEDTVRVTKVCDLCSESAKENKVMLYSD